MKLRIKKLQSWIRSNKWELTLIIILLIISATAHAWNMFHFPYYESDEGTYTGQAWSLVTEGKLAPYTYWYDHAPGGWMFLALWAKLTGGFFTFGFSVNTGRVLILILHVLSALFLYLIAKRLTNSKIVGAVSVLCFSLSPLAIFFQRRVLLDNIMVFWLLLSLFLLLNYSRKLRMVIFSALTFAVALLTKETAIFFIPVFVYIIFTTAHSKNRKFAIFTWLSIVCAVTSIYFLFAILKGEFFQSGTYLGGHSPHVSLLETLKFQSERGADSGIFSSKQADTFLYNLKIWLRDDPLFILTGVFASLTCLLAGIKNHASRIIGLLSLSYWLFLARGGQVFEFYIPPLVPFISLCIGCTAWLVTGWIKDHLPDITLRRLSTALINVSVLGLAFICLYLGSQHIRGENLFTSDQTTPQKQAVNWTLSQNGKNQFIAIDMYGYVDLHARNNDNFKNAEYYWKVNEDPAIRTKILFNNSDNIDYFATTPQFEHDVNEGLAFVGPALSNATPIKNFWNDGWGVRIWAAKSPKQILNSSWDSYKRKFIEKGRVKDIQNDGLSTSEGQSYALLRSVWLDDQTQFDQTWSWTKTNLQRPDGLFSWKSKNGEISDKSAATDADEDIALSLLLANKKWGDKTYLSDAREILNGIWSKEVVNVKDEYILSAGDWANQEDQVIINPSYLSPASYKIFAEADSAHPWLKVTDSSYKLIDKCTFSMLDTSKGVLPPEWCAINKQTLLAETAGSPQPNATEYSYNAFRVSWRIALDYQWNKDKRSMTYLKKLSFLNSEWESKNKLVAAYTHDGKVWENYETVAAYGGDIGYFKVVNPKLAKKIYETKILSKFYQGEDYAYWEDPDNYYTQNWAWFGTALYADQLPNYWPTKITK